jgi:hypothetical protein
MELELRPAPAVHWADNELTGYRHVGIFNGAVKIFACVSHKCMGEWKSSLIPMGYSYTREEAHELAQLFSTIDSLMNYIESDEEMSHDDITSYLGMTNDNN